MKLGIRTRIMTLMALLGVLASGLTGYYAYLSSHHLLAEAAEREMLTSARVIGRSFSTSIREVAKDAALLAELPVTRIVADLPDSSAQAATARDPHLGGDQAALADDDVVRDLHQVVDLCACSDYRIAKFRPVNAAVGANFDEVLDDDAAVVGDERVGALDERISEADGADRAVGLNDHMVT